MILSFAGTARLESEQAPPHTSVATLLIPPGLLLATSVGVSSVEKTHKNSVSDDVSVHRTQNLGTLRRTRQVELDVERVELKRVVVRRSGRRAGSAETDVPSDVLTLPRTVWQVGLGRHVF